MGAMRLRNPLFAPADSARKMEKALASPADAVILDLEDSVAEGQKAAAREVLRGMLPGVSRAGLIVRVNPVGTAHHLADLAAVVPGRPAAIMLPKCNGGGRAGGAGPAAFRTRGSRRPGGRRYPACCRSRRRRRPPCWRWGRWWERRGCAGLCFGAEDLAADLGTPPRLAGGAYPAATVAARGLLLLAAAACGVPAIDTPWPDPRDPEGLLARGAGGGGGRVRGQAVHPPDQIAPVAEVFTPDRMRLDWARLVVAGFAANPGAGVFSLDGRDDRPAASAARGAAAGPGRAGVCPGIATRALHSDTFRRLAGNTRPAISDGEDL